MIETKVAHGVYDRSTWGSGPWDNEPDKMQYWDSKYNFPVVIKRNAMGSLCGYVGVSPGHPWYGQRYDKVDVHGEYVSVHGGLTHADGCDHGEWAKSICHTVPEGQPDDVFWLGFDCGHCDDISPKYVDLNRELRGFGAVYRDWTYVTQECKNLAAQAAKVRDEVDPRESILVGASL
jgi:thiol-disulfide isomerase/thioredoxin